jgi:mRNA-degrading endonuclease toxin of MazEF toxin-antitoxin module
LTAKAIHYRKGDVVLVSFPYTTDEGTIQAKRRPAVIISGDYNNARLDDVLVVPLTGYTSKLEARESRWLVMIAMNSPEGQAAGLRLDSVIDCTIIATIPKTLLVNKIGRFQDETMRRVDQCIRRSIDLPDDDDLTGTAVPRKPFPFDDEGGVAMEEPEPKPDDEPQ